jgi:murein DD-endopeptidase MepM/ murein hydrolase activator NlpD
MNRARLLARLVPMAVAAVLILAIGVHPAFAEHELYRFKWPYQPGVASGTTGYPFTGHHATQNAWDFDIALDNDGDPIASSAEGIVTAVVSGYEPESCDPNDGSGYGNHVEVQVATAVPGQYITVRYAHLASVSVGLGSRVLQGDQIGIEGKTGHTEGDEEPGYKHPGKGLIGCGTHLHFQFLPQRPEDIDGDDVSPATGPTSTAGGPSTNSYISGIQTPSQAIRQKFKGLGDLGFGPSWGVAGWTSDITGTQWGCGGWQFCQLYIHYEPNPVTGAWGSVITLRKHPESNWYADGFQAWEYNAIMAGRWAVNDAYWVRLPFHRAWLLANFTQRIGLPLMDQIGTYPGLCPTSLGCTAYQRFSHGYVWRTSGGIRPAVFCPDVNGADFSPWPDYYVDLAFDIQGTIQHYSPSGYAGEPYEPSTYAQFDLNGDGVIDLANDILVVVSHYDQHCYPQ